MEAELIESVAISIVAAAVMAYLSHRLHQPLIIGYILAGVLIGPELGLGLVGSDEASQGAIEAISELGLIVLLFIIGLEMDLRKMIGSGKTIIILGIFQFLLCVALGLAFFKLPGFGDGGTYAYQYLAATFALSSTTLVVKILYDKSELDTLPGRITLGLLIIQDLWVILLLTVQPNITDLEPGTVAGSFLQGAALVVGALLVSRFLLPLLFKTIADIPELTMVTALGWCFLVSYLAGDVADLSREMGALIAGISISTFPYNLEVTTRVINIRDFFLTLFFVTLGMKITQPSSHIFFMALLASLFLIVSRFATVFPILYLRKKSFRISFLVPLNISQISEFSIILVALGLNDGHVNQDIMNLILFTLIITFTVSTYAINYSYGIFRGAYALMRKLGFKDIDEKNTEEAVDVNKRPVLLLGFRDIARHFLRDMEDLDLPLREKIAVVDYNPETYYYLVRRGIPCTYGDLANIETLVRCGLNKAKVIVSSVPDELLKGTSNGALLTYIKRVNPSARVVVTAGSTQMAQELYNAGADFVLEPWMETADRMIPVLEELMTSIDQSDLPRH
ncbi:cation:proton antiporter [Chloroflexota bacterium]